MKFLTWSHPLKTKCKWILILSHHQENQNSTLSRKSRINHESTSKFKKKKKIDPEAKIKSDPKWINQNQNCDFESMSSKRFFLKHSAEVTSNNILFEAILRNCILTRHSFGATFWSCIPTLSFEAILWNCILKTFTLGKFYGIVFSKYFLQDNSLDSYYTKVSLRKFCGIVFSKHFIWGNSTELYFHNTFSLRQFYEIVLSKHVLWGNSTELYSQNIPLWFSFGTTL